MKRKALMLCLFSIMSSSLSNVLEMPDSNRRTKMIGGKEAKPNQLPYLVSIYHTNRKHNCGGGILNDRYILTAAHCIINPNTGKFFDIPMEIVVDTVDLENDPGVRIRIEKAFVPKNYVQAGNFNDIGILKLSSSLDLSNNPQRQKLNLPKAGDNFDDQIATIAGFGWTDSNDYSTIGKHLKYWTSKVISKNDCINYWRNEVNQDYLCAQMLPLPNAAAVGICNGDSGSPLVIHDTVIGVAVIAEWNCDERVKPALYTKVSIHLPFIETVLTGQHNNVAEYDFPST
ncbi:serine protease 87 isoform X1 [Nasonia vitripennis]|uniref:Peptidase S1 domain-containing protein n=1 Tax=Nasonia vitripennis TaxID=7425 RepID=A0A7M7ITN5_NASVI|nr:serine protease 87 precursor [Nasonia vitripennis]XP_016841008.1 serine protease 87 isoform X1 [Nasonia vitripennis]